jgi:hypothetical protein
MNTRAIVSIASVAAALALVLAGVSSAASPITGRPTHLTFSAPVGLPGVSLPAGTYTFLTLEGRPDIVRVQSHDGTAVHYTGFTRIVPRPRDARMDRAVTFSEVPRGQPARINIWYPEGSTTGRQFVYDAHAR